MNNIQLKEILMVAQKVGLLSIIDVNTPDELAERKIEAFAQTYALQSSEPVWILSRDSKGRTTNIITGHPTKFDISKLPDDTPLYTLPPSTVSLEKHNKRIAELKATNKELLDALKQSMVALDDWLSMFASEFCEENRVKEAFKRITEKGTVGYIADVQEINRKAIAEAEGRS